MIRPKIAVVPSLSAEILAVARLPLNEVDIGRPTLISSAGLFAAKAPRLALFETPDAVQLERLVMAARFLASLPSSSF